MRVDSSPILLAGQAQAQANQAFGNAVGGVVEKFYQKKKDKQEREQRERAYREAGLNAEEAKAASGDKELGSLLINKMNADRNFLIEQEKAKRAADLFNFQKQNYENRFEERERLLEEAEENELADNQFIAKIVGSSSVPTGQLNEAGQDELERGSLFIAPTKEAVSDFKDTLLRDPSTQTKVPMMDLEGNQFIRQFSEDSPEVQRRALNFMQARQKDAPSMSRLVTIQDGKGGFEQVGLNSAGDPIRSYGPPKPSGMYPTPEEARKQKILIGRTEDAMESVKSYVEGSSLAIKQAEQANLALKNIPDTTGGITSFFNDMKVLAESVGIDLPEDYTKDMKDIGLFRQLTGQFLFNAMSKTKGSITENEMRLFRQISPDIDNSKAANEAMLGLYVKAGERAKGRRDLIRGLQEKDVDPREIERAIEKFDEENSLMEDIEALAPQSEQQTFRIGQKQVEGEVVGKKPDGSLIVKTKDGQFFIKPAQ